MRIALIGGGPAAVSMMESLIHVRDEINRDVILDVTVFDPSPNPWCGANFGPDIPEALTNSYTADMSVRYWDPNHISEWLRANNYEDFIGTKFAPRAIFGQYFQNSAEKATLYMNAFNHISEQVIKVSINSGVVIETPMGSYHFDYAVLCVGGKNSSDPYELQGQSNFFSTPYPLKETVTRVNSDEHVGIIGSGLTAIDLTLGLIANNHCGTITLMSRNGLLPSIRRPPIQYSPRYFTVKAFEEIVAMKGTLTLKDVLNLTFKELDYAGVSKQSFIDGLFSKNYGFTRLRHQMEKIDDGDITEQIVIKILSDAFEDGWYLLRLEDKKLLMNEFLYIKSSHCCPIPRQRAAKILELADSGQLKVVRGLQSISINDQEKFEASIEGTSTIQFDKVFSAITSGSQPSPLAKPIIDGLLQSGQACMHPLGGLNVERTTSKILDENNQPQSQLYALGSTINGALYIFNGLYFMVQRSAHVAESIFNHHLKKNLQAKNNGDVDDIVENSYYSDAEPILIMENSIK